MRNKVIIIGAGGLAKIVADIIEKSNDKIVGVLDDNLTSKFLGKYKILGKIKDANKLNKKNVKFIVAIGNTQVREDLVEKNKELDYYTAIHPKAIIAKDTVIRQGSIICAGAVINPNATIREHVLINANVVVEHDVIINKFVNIDANATVLGEAIVCKGESVSTNTLIQRREIIGKLNTDKDLISIVTPMYNAEKYIDETIKSVIDQTYTNWELIIVDDKSKDNSVRKVKKHKDDRIRVVEVETNGGPAIARNIGIDNAKGRYLCFQDADDLWENDKLEKQVEFMRKNNVAFSYTSYEFADSEGKPNGKQVVVPEKITYKEALKNTTISTITVMFDLLILDKELVKMPNISYGEDTATWWQVLKSGVDAYGLKKVFSYYRRTNTSLSANKLKTLFKVWKLYRREKLNIFYTTYCYIVRNIKAFLRRV